MMLSGDECRRTQHGNNNAYCQDNEVSWFDWTLVDKHADLLRFCRGADFLPPPTTDGTPQGLYVRQTRGAVRPCQTSVGITRLAQRFSGTALIERSRASSWHRGFPKTRMARAAICC